MSFDLTRSLLADAGFRGAAVAGAPYPPPQQPAASVPFRPSVAVIVVVLTTMFSLTFLLLLYAKHRRRQAAAVSSSNSSGLSGSAHGGTHADRRSSGVDRAVVESLPLFRFESLRGEKEGLECAVCLSRFEPTELLRLLPKCRHAFHVDCVDAWFDLHSTCPLCRSRIDAEDVLLLCYPDPVTLPMGANPSPLPEKPSGRRISGRHSSAGEKSSGGGVLRLVIHRPSESSARSAAPAPVQERQRKDRMLLPAAMAEEEGEEGRYSHRVALSFDGGAQERWSDLRPSDLMFLRLETTITGSGRLSAVAGGGCGGRPWIGLRSSSEIAGVSRLPMSRAGNPARPVTEERTMRKWLSFAAKRTARWLARRSGG
ncbi:RING-H2 finger protein ATL43 [Apostasia shenzhenica]|uniref:RING-type E3 ubiquitin transferase n=1 Tax=Apostasia shenzhenica TaxID=1088818 RepID=A0A2I0A770_9ASPA|nr:RING-H2 finger protein ATL43 [Apostasia shenzhenica]